MGDRTAPKIAPPQAHHAFLDLRPSRAGFSATFLSSKSGGTISRAKSADRGALMKPTSKSRVAGSISTAPTIRREKRWIFC